MGFVPADCVRWCERQRFPPADVCNVGVYRVDTLAFPMEPDASRPLQPPIHTTLKKGVPDKNRGG